MVSKRGTTIDLHMGVRIAEHALHEPALLLQDERFEKIAHRFGVADDVLPDGALAVSLPKIYAPHRKSKVRWPSCLSSRTPGTRSGRGSLNTPKSALCLCSSSRLR